MWLSIGRCANVRCPNLIFQPSAAAWSKRNIGRVKISSEPVFRTSRRFACTGRQTPIAEHYAYSESVVLSGRTLCPRLSRSHRMRNGPGEQTALPLRAHDGCDDQPAPRRSVCLRVRRGCSCSRLADGRGSGWDATVQRQSGSQRSRSREGPTYASTRADERSFFASVIATGYFHRLLVTASAFRIRCALRAVLAGR